MTLFLIVVGIVIFLCAYSLGKQQGRKAGIQEGKSIMILELREESLIAGCCFFCGNRKNQLTCEDNK